MTNVNTAVTLCWLSRLLTPIYPSNRRSFHILIPKMSARVCQLCGKPLSRLWVGGDGDYCSKEHRSQHRLRQGMDRLEEASKVTSLMRRRENPRHISTATIDAQFRARPAAGMACVPTATDRGSHWYSHPARSRSAARHAPPDGTWRIGRPVVANGGPRGAAANRRRHHHPGPGQPRMERRPAARAGAAQAPPVHAVATLPDEPPAPRDFGMLSRATVASSGCKGRRTLPAERARDAGRGESRAPSRARAGRAMRCACRSASGSVLAKANWRTRREPALVPHRRAGLAGRTLTLAAPARRRTRTWRSRSSAAVWFRPRRRRSRRRAVRLPGLGEHGQLQAAHRPAGGTAARGGNWQPGPALRHGGYREPPAGFARRNGAHLFPLCCCPPTPAARPAGGVLRLRRAQDPGRRCPTESMAFEARWRPRLPPPATRRGPRALRGGPKAARDGPHRRAFRERLG